MNGDVFSRSDSGTPTGHCSIPLFPFSPSYIYFCFHSPPSIPITPISSINPHHHPHPHPLSTLHLAPSGLRSDLCGSPLLPLYLSDFPAIFSSLGMSAAAGEMQGIVSILGFDCERNKVSSLRRTLSADMSSRKWLSQNGVCPMKKIASSEQISALIEDCGDGDDGGEGRGQTEIWNSIQEEKKLNEMRKNSFHVDLWSSIVCQNASEKNSISNDSVPYVHPLVKSCSSSLSEKSLEICTESLGSETGSDRFSLSENGEVEEEKEEEHDEKVSQTLDGEEVQVVKYNFVVGKKSIPRSFPPPLPSLTRRDRASMHMQSYRENGRLVLEAVSVATKTNFLAQRQDGRLLLTFTPEMVDAKHDEMEQIEIQKEDNEFEEEEFEEMEEIEIDNGGKEMEKAPNFHRLASMMHKPIEIANRNPTWPQKFNITFKLEEVEEVDHPTPLAQSLPPLSGVAQLIPRTAAATAMTTGAATAAASFNAYEYFWRSKPTSDFHNPDTKKAQPLHNNGNNLIISKNPIANEQKQMLVLKGEKEESIAPLLRGCKEARRSLSLWETHCIATS